MFVLDKESYFFGEKVQPRNSSINMKEYRWDFGDGSSEDKEYDPAPHIYKEEGSYTITLKASHKSNMKKSKSESKQVTVTSYNVYKIVVNSIPNITSWDNGSGPDLKIKINDTNSELADIFAADYTFDIQDNVDSTDLPVTKSNIFFKFTYSDWSVRLLDEDLPLPNTEMKAWTVNAYKEGSNEKVKLSGNGFDIDIYYTLSN